MQREVKNKQPGTGPAWEEGWLGRLAVSSQEEDQKWSMFCPSDHRLCSSDSHHFDQGCGQHGSKNTPLTLMRVQPELPISLSLSGSPGRRVSILWIPSVQLLPLYNTKVQPAGSSGSGCSFKFQEGKRLASAEQWLLPSGTLLGLFLR